MQNLVVLLAGVLILSACGNSHGIEEGTCDPDAREGDACMGTWVCPVESIEGSTGTHYSETRCEAEVVRVRRWMDPPFVDDAGASDAGADAATGPDAGPDAGIDAGPGPAGCRLVLDEPVASDHRPVFVELRWH